MQRCQSTGILPSFFPRDAQQPLDIRADIIHLAVSASSIRKTSSTFSESFLNSSSRYEISVFFRRRFAWPLRTIIRMTSTAMLR